MSRQVLSIRIISIITIVWIFFGLPLSWLNSRIPPSVSEVHAVASSTKYAGSAEDQLEGLDCTWTNPSNASGDTTGTSATCSLGGNNKVGNRLTVENFGFTSGDIPEGATIDGVTVEVEWNGTGTNIVDNIVRLTTDGSNGIGDNKALNASQSVKGFQTYGGASDNWGIGLTQAQIISSTFGVNLQYIKNSGGPPKVANVYRVRITINYTVTAPTVSTQAISDITSTTATANGTISSIGGENADIRGFVYDTTSRTLPGNVVPGSSGYASSVEDSGSFGSGTFTKGLTGLTAGSTYFVRAYAHNSAGYSYGNEVSFSSVLISVSLTSDGTINYGNVNIGESKSSIELSDTQIIQNDGNVTTDFNIKTSNATGGTQWSVGSTAGTDIYVHEYSTNAGSNWNVLTAADSYQVLTTGVGVGNTQPFDLRITVPTSTSDYQQKTITITVQAVQQ